MGDPAVDLKEAMTELGEGGWLYRMCERALDSGDPDLIHRALFQAKANLRMRS